MAHTTTRITQGAIQRARAAFDQRVREAASTTEGLRFDDIAIAHEVTREQLERVPSEWLAGIKVMLRADGVLLITKLKTFEHRDGCDQLALQLGGYAGTRGLSVGTERELTLGDGTIVKPDVQIYARGRGRNAAAVPLALFELEVHHRCMPEITSTADFYLDSFPSVERVVFVKFYPPREPDLRTHRLVRVPAVVIVFRRSTSGVGRIEVAQMQSFGNAAIDRPVARNFTEPADHLDPFQVQEHHRAPAAWLPDRFDVDTLDDQLAELEAQPDHELLEVAMPAPWAAIPVDLVRVFTAVMWGWREHRAFGGAD